MNGVTVLVLLGLAAAATADDCGPLQRIKVKAQWSEIYSVDHDREAFATAVWKNYFEDHPDRSLFDKVNGGNVYSAEFRAHMVRVFAGFDILVSVLDDEPVFKQATAHYAKFHKSFGDIPFEAFGQAIVNVLPDFLEGRFDQGAWSGCYNYVAKAMHG